VTLPDPKPELIVLINLQLAALEKEVFGVVTDAERREYWRRHERIRKLYRHLNEMPGLESASERFNVKPIPGRRPKTRAACFNRAR
jgi:hypothetical protein